MDPLSVGDSTVGLLTASLEVGKLFAAQMTTHDYARTVHDEIHYFRFILFKVHKYTHSGSVNFAQASMIDLHHVTTVLMGCMYTLSELEREVRRLDSGSEGLRRMKWMMAEPRLVDLVEQLKNNKGTICSMLPILTSHSQDIALNCMHEVQRRIEEPARINTQMGYKPGPDAAGSPFPSRDRISGSVMSTRSGVSFTSLRTKYAATLNGGPVYRRALFNSGNWEGAEQTFAEITEPSRSVLSVSPSAVSTYAANYSPIDAKNIYNTTWYTRPHPVVALEPDMAELPAYLAIALEEDLNVALIQNDMETAKAIATYVSWETVLKMSALYPTLAPGPLNSVGKVLDSLSLFELWLQCGGDPKAKNQHGQTAIKKALENEDWRLFKLLARNGSDINLTLGSRTVLHHVLGEGGEAFVLGLCENMEEEDMADIATIGYDLERKRGQAVDILLNLGADINAADGWEKTALHWFSEGGHKGMVEFLLSRGADIHAKDMWGTTSLHGASEGGHKAVVEILLNHSADVNAKDKWGMAAIYYASEGGHRGVVEVLLRHGADIGSKDKWEKTTLHYASWCGDKGVVEVLLGHGADIHAGDMWGTTSLHWASEYGHKGVVKILLRRGADINAKDRWGMTALHHASKGGHKGVVKILLRRGADINAKDRSEDTALHLASENGHNGVIELLSSRGADISGKDE